MFEAFAWTHASGRFLFLAVALSLASNNSLYVSRKETKE
jgi:hypothetical protein